MKRNVKRVISITIALIMAISTIGCSSNNDGERNSQEGSNEEITEIDLWTISTDGVEKASEAFENAIKAVGEERPDIQINYSSADGGSYKTKIKTAVAAGEMPDIFYTWLPGYSENFVESGNVLKLDDYISQDAKDNMNMTAVESGNSLYDGIYAIPIESKMGILYCNEGLFDEYGIKIPDTYEELLTVIDEFNAVGIQPFEVAGKRIWPLMWIYDILAVQTVGADESISALKKETSFDQPGFLSAANKVVELTDANAFPESFIGLDNPEANANFMNGKSPMYFSGSWSVASFADDKNPVSKDLVARRFPDVGEGHGKDVLGGAGDGYMINSETADPETAVWVLEKFSKALCESDTILFPIWNVEKDFTEFHPVYQELDDLYQEADNFVIWWDTYLNGDDAETHKNLVAELFAGVKTPEEFIVGMKEISDN